MSLTVIELQEFLRGGHFTRVVFVKRTNGEIRKMICRSGVRKGVTGAGAPYNFAEKGLLPVWDAQKRHFRCIAAENVLEIRSGKREYLAQEEAS